MGAYDLAACARIDQLLTMAARSSTYVVLTMHTFSELTTSAAYAPLWAANPYNAANGGPCATPQDFFTNEAAMQLTLRRYRYIVSRFGAYSNVFAFEHFNEVDLVS